MELVVSRENLRTAAEAVRRNKGAAGVTIWEVEEHFKEYYLLLRQKLLNSTYKPKSVKRVEISKPNGTKRKLGIPCVRNRVVQQAIKQVIEPIIGPNFPPQSHGFHPHKGKHTALKQCIEYYEKGYKVVVDCDLKQYFDTLNHDKLMYHLEQFIRDGAILQIIRKFLVSGVTDLSGEFVESKTGGRACSEKRDTFY
ncbi:reverse transcriptase domain-containing protein [Carnobacterium sp.]|uniref:reverse transcriptase domain-containing protein n=1 Tax=Carnobacterium sp. TaxID=48221 RepID=UPI0028B12EBC|nr:reverse transcriptase domain-containing protein [Carnobacterium sp.]